MWSLLPLTGEYRRFCVEGLTNCRRIDMLRTVSTRQAVADLRISGNVIYTGRSSMEIAVKMEALHPDAEPDTLMIGT